MPAAVTGYLTAHLTEQLGAWPPAQPLVLTTSPARERPGWDGVIRPFSGVRTPKGAVLSVPGDVLETARRATAGSATLEEARYALESVLGGPVGEVVFRWGARPASLEPLGEWMPAEDPRLPDWLRPFGGDTLVAWDDEGRYLAGIGLKRHDAHGWEIAVGTEEHARGLGLARRLVATAARHILDLGKVPLYLHALDNAPSARVADAAGFPDAGWRGLFVVPEDSTVDV